jgi:hypothetical protein
MTPRSGDGLAAGGEFTADQGEGFLYRDDADLAGPLPQQLLSRQRSDPSTALSHRLTEHANADVVLLQKGADVIERLGHTGRLAQVPIGTSRGLTHVHIGT